MSQRASFSKILLMASIVALVSAVERDGLGQTYQGYPTQAQTYAEHNQRYYEYSQRQRHRGGIDCCTFDEPANSVHLRGGGGGGPTWGIPGGEGGGGYAEASLGVRLVGETYNRLDADFVSLVIDAGFHFMSYELTDGPENDAGILSVYLGFLGNRFGWGGYVGDLFVLGRGLVGATEYLHVGGGLQVGLGAELYFGAIGIEASYLWLYYRGVGHTSTSSRSSWDCAKSSDADVAVGDVKSWGQDYPLDT
jgi:hypothetical protein